MGIFRFFNRKRRMVVHYRDLSFWSDMKNIAKSWLLTYLHRFSFGFGAMVYICLTLVSLSADAAQPGDAGLFDTWAGYSVGRSPIAVTAVDFNGDGAPDVAWARHDWFHGQIPGNSMTVQLNLGDGTLGAPTDWPSVDMSTDIGSADLDGDGDADIVVISEGTSLINSTINIYLSNGDGTFTVSTTTGGEAPQRLALADFDGDGDIDLAITDSGTLSGMVSVLFNNGNATFGSERRISVGGSQVGIAAADLDGDGDIDLAVGGLGLIFVSQVALLANDGSGIFTFAGSIQPSPTEFIAAPLVVAGDLDGDGDTDLVAAGGNSTSHVVMLNQGGFTFTQETYIGGYGSINLAIADHDGDGDLDLYSATQGSSFAGDVSYFVNQGNGTFASAIIIESSHQPQDIAVADFNQDGRVDIAVPNRGTNTGVIHPQGVTAAFEAPPTYPTFNSPDSVVTADFDGDGDLDVASSVPASQIIDVKFNDGTGALTSIASIPSTHGQPTSVWATDLNGDTLPDILWTANSFPPEFAVAINQGNGLFSAPTFTAPAGCSLDRVTTADIDNDGDQDIIGTGYGTWCFGQETSISINLNDGTGTFAAGNLIDITLFEPTMALGIDMNGDGLTDLVGMSSASWPNGDIAVALGTGNGTFASGTLYITGMSHRELAVADFDNDGDFDIATSNLGIEDSTSVLLNDGNGNLGLPSTYNGESIPGITNQWALDTGDVNGDGNIDIVVANRTGRDIGVYFGHGDGTFEGEQMRYGMHADLTDVELADMNGDGRLDAVGPTNPTGTTTSPIVNMVAKIAANTIEVAAIPGPGVSVLLNGLTPGNRFTLNVIKTGSGNGQVTSNPPGINCGISCSYSYETGTLVILTATPVNNSTFTGWSGACTGTALTCEVQMTSAKSVNATFTASNMYTLTVTKTGNGKGLITSNPAGINCGTTCLYSYAPGTLVKLMAIPDNNSIFTGWSGACNGTAKTCKVKMTASKSVTANFSERSYTLTVTKTGTGKGKVTSNPAGIDCGNTCSYSYAPGTLVTLTATPSEDSIFTGWSGSCTGIATKCKVLMSASKSVIARFTQKRK